MKALKFLLLWVVLSIVMLVTWSIGFVAGNAITHTSPPAGGDPILAFFSFIGVCVFNSLLLSLFLWFTRMYSGISKTIWVVAYCFVIQFFLTQMETIFFGQSISIENPQVVSILIAGFIMSSITVLTGVLTLNKMFSTSKQSFGLAVNEWRPFVVPFLALICIVYPFIYLTFGYYIAWQNENLRVFYTKSAEMNSFFHQLADSFASGIYFFQILRAAIWVIVTMPIIVMLRDWKAQYFLVGVLTSLLPASLLFIPNPYMPRDIAMTHFVETASSNFIWGLAMTFAINKYLRVGQREEVHSTLEKTTG